MHNLLLENCFFTKADITFSKTTYTIKVSHLGSYYLNFADLDVKNPQNDIKNCVSHIFVYYKTSGKTCYQLNGVAKILHSISWKGK